MRPGTFTTTEVRSYKQVGHGQELYVGNSSTAKVIGQGKVIFQLSSGKSLTLTEVLHVPEVRKNLVFGSVLSKNGFELVFEANKFVVTMRFL